MKSTPKTKGEEEDGHYQKITVSLPPEMRRRIDRLSASEQRPRSNWLAFYLPRLLDSVETGTARAAEPEAKYQKPNGKTTPKDKP